MVQPILTRFKEKYDTYFRCHELDVEPHRQVAPPTRDEDMNVTQLATKFHIAYKAKFAQSKAGLFACFRNSNLPQNAQLAAILTHAIYNGGKRSLEVLQELGWLNANKQSALENKEFRKCLTDEVHNARDEAHPPMTTPQS